MKKNDLRDLLLAILMFIAFAVYCLFFSSCKSIKYVPVESVRTAYRDNYLRDSVYLHDSTTTVIRQLGDTVFKDVEKYKYLYRDKIIRDSIVIRDSVQIPYPVEVEKPVKYVSGWQNFQIWLGRIFIWIVLGCIVFFFIKRKSGK